MNAPRASAGSDRAGAWMLAAGSALFAAVMWRMGERWMNARALVACCALALAAIAAAQAMKPSPRMVGVARVTGVTVVMLVAASWRSGLWLGWAVVALALAGLDAARSRDDDRALAPAAIGAAVCVSWNAWRYDVPPLRVFVFAMAAGLLAARVRGRGITR